jgi:hypothetical protein
MEKQEVVSEKKNLTQHLGGKVLGAAEGFG